MSYIWYPDVFFLRNFLMDLTAFFTVAACFRIPAKKWTLVFAAAISAAGSVILFYLLKHFLMYRCLIHGLVNPLLILLFFRPTGGWDYLKKWGGVYLLLLLFGGIHTCILSTASGEITGIGLSTAVCMLCGFAVVWLWRRRTQDTSFFPADLIWNGKRMRCTAYADTGNVLRDVYTGKAVSIIGKAEFEQIFFAEIQEIPPRLIPFRTLGNDHGLLPIYTLDQMVIYTGKQGDTIDAPVIGVGGQGCVIGKRDCLLLNSEFCSGRKNHRNKGDGGV